MAKYRIIFSLKALSDIDNLVQFVASIYTFEAGKRFGKHFRSQIYALRKSAGAFAVSNKKDVLAHHPQAKSVYIGKKKKWLVIFWVERDICYIERIIPSASVKE